MTAFASAPANGAQKRFSSAIYVDNRIAAVGQTLPANAAPVVRRAKPALHNLYGDKSSTRYPSLERSYR